MRISRLGLFLLIGTTTFGLFASGVHASGRFADRPPVHLVIEAPERLGFRGVLLTEGWPLTISMEVGNAVAFVTREISSGSGDLNSTQALVIDDPDGCLDMRDFDPFAPVPYEPGCPGQDERFFEFTFDPFDAAREQESRCASSTPPFILVDDPFDALTVADLNKQYVEVASAVSPRPVGARSGGSRDDTQFPSHFDDPAFDCYGHGADVDGVPGLVVWAEIGGFLVLDEDLNGTGPGGAIARVRNGAGFVTNVTSVLLDWLNRSSVKATIVVPRGLFEPIVAIDTVVNPAGPFNGFDYLRRIDNGPVEGLNFGGPVGENVARARAISADLPPIRTVVKAVLVEGPAPDFINDVDMNGRFTAADLVADGHTLLSNVAWYRIDAVRAYNIETGGDRCPPVDMLVAKDLDGADPPGGAFPYSCDTGSARSSRRVPR